MKGLAPRVGFEPTTLRLTAAILMLKNKGLALFFRGFRYIRFLLNDRVLPLFLTLAATESATVGLRRFAVPSCCRRHAARIAARLPQDGQ